MKMKKTIAMLMAMTMAGVVTACKKVNTYSAKDCYSMEVVGADGYGNLDIDSNESILDAIILENIPDDATELEYAKYEILLASMEIEADKTENLSNGDTISLKVKLDEEAFEAMNIMFTDTEFTYTVSGLEEPVEIDLFENVTVTYEGISSDGDAMVEYTGNDEFIKNNVSYNLSKSWGLSNGDVITVNASYNETVADENKIIIISENSADYTVEGLAEYLKENHEGLNEITDKMTADIEERFKDSETFSVGAVSAANAFFKSGWVHDEYKVLSYTITPCHRFISIDNYGKNTYGVFYKMNFELEKTKKDTSSTGDGREVGELVTSDDIYVCMYLNDIIKNSDGTLEYDIENIGNRDFLRNFLENYIGASFDEVYESFIGSETVSFSEDM